MAATLTGSDKQIEWAERVRATALDEVRQLVTFEEQETQKRIESLEFRRGSALEARMERRLTEQREQEAHIRDLVGRTVACMEAETSAAWWIEHRDWTGYQHVRKATGELLG